MNIECLAFEIYEYLLAAGKKTRKELIDVYNEKDPHDVSQALGVLEGKNLVQKVGDAYLAKSVD